MTTITIIKMNETEIKRFWAVQERLFTKSREGCSWVTRTTDIVYQTFNLRDQGSNPW